MNSQSPKVSVVLATYEWPEALALVLSGLSVQTEPSFEVLVADDGSGSETRRVIELYQLRGKFLLRHFRQEHQGFRKSRILNQAIGAARGEVLVFLDGDCVPHKDYVKEHLALHDDSTYVAGRRVDLSQEFTATLSPVLVERGYLNGHLFGLFRLWLDSFRKDGSTPFHRAYVVRSAWLRKICGLENVVDLKGCNFSVGKRSMVAINGFDERFEGYGREDTDVEYRLQHLGLKIKSAKNLCLQFHLWHEPRAFTPVNETLLAHMRSSRAVRAVRGLNEGEQGKEVSP